MSKQIEAQLRQAKTARAALQDEVVRLKRELNEAQASGVPEGWKLVPVEPTQEMIDESVDWSGQGIDRHQAMGRFVAGWKRVLAAAPEPPCAAPVVSSAGIEEACQRYTEMLLGKYPAMVAAQADTSVSWRPSGSHVLWMLEQIPTLSPTKAHRWLGFIQGALVYCGITSVDAERKATRGMFDDGEPCASPAIDNAVCESEGAESDRKNPSASFDDYDAGLLNDYGGGNVSWWQDYIRSEIGRANDHWRGQVESASDKHDPPCASPDSNIFDRVQEVITAVYDREMQIEDAAREVIDLCDGTITAKQEVHS